MLEAGFTQAAPDIVAPTGGDQPQAIVILSGDQTHVRIGGATAWRVGALTLEREAAGAALARQTHLPVLVTGGTIRVGAPTLAAQMAVSLRQDFAIAARWREEESKDTWQNAAFSAAILHAHGISRVYVVTHAWHMRRALAAFRHAGLDAVPAPVQIDDKPDFSAEAFIPAVRRLAGQLLRAARADRLGVVCGARLTRRPARRAGPNTLAWTPCRTVLARCWESISSPQPIGIARWWRPACRRGRGRSSWRCRGRMGSRRFFPMLVRGRTASALTTPYTALWQPLIAARDAAERAAVWQAFAGWCHGFASVRLDAMDEAVAACITDGLRGAGLAGLPFRHFGNWHGGAADGWPAYLSERPGQLREAIRRRGKRLTADGGMVRIVSRPDEIEAGIEAYEQVYARSWKPAEPFPAFNPTLMRACARAGSLRLGLICREGAVVAAQIWVVHGRWAAVLKLAHDEAAREYSPGTVLTARMIEHLLTQDGIAALDFGRGDDAYKKDWVEGEAAAPGPGAGQPQAARRLGANDTGSGRWDFSTVEARLEKGV